MGNPAKYIRDPKQLASLASLKDVYNNADYYTMDYVADYRLDDVLAHGAVSAEDLMALLKKLLIADKLPVPTPPGAGCSIFTARNKKGHVLVGRNLDFRHKPHDPSVMMLRTAPSQGYRAFNMVDLGFMPLPKGFLSDGTSDISPAVMFPYLVLDGINEKGLFIGVMQLKFPQTKQDTGKVKVSTTLMMRAVLDKAADVDEAVKLFASYDMQSPRENNDYHFLLADRSGRSLVIEYVDNEMKVLEADCCTNFYLAPEKEKAGGGKARYEIIQKILEFREHTLEKKDMMDVLRLVSQPAGQLGKSDTLWSAVYDLTDLSMDLVVLHRYGRARHYKL